MTTSLHTTNTVAPASTKNDDDTVFTTIPKLPPLNKRPYIQQGTPEFIRVALALFSAGLATDRKSVV